MTLDPTLAAIRFGTGRAPHLPDPAGADAMLAALTGPDRMAVAHPVPSFASIYPATREIAEIDAARRAGEATEEALARKTALVRGFRAQQAELMAVAVARGLDSTDPLRERLTWFWADHFTVVSKRMETRSAAQMYVEDAIRPHVTGRFVDMLTAVATHPMMLLYLDQHQSVGPHSAVARKRPGLGLNENFARELMELHTLGVDGPYTQDDVRELAELLAGMHGTHRTTFVYKTQRAEPGPETVLGRNYGRREPKFEDVERVLEDLARHPATARYIAQKLAVHFVSDRPDPDLVATLEHRFTESDGDLLEVTRALLTHPAAGLRPMEKAKPPFDFVVSSLRALGMQGRDFRALDVAALRRQVLTPLARMGQPWQAPDGPDGWPEAADAWITPQGLAERITWAMGLERLWGLEMPDPRDFVRTALGDVAGRETLLAARAAETRGEGVALVLASPEFQRR
ncbi:DUF1800 domain-containing protein [Tropicimonas marinistellae]|uniref:DUF1800 domain-containing protein n=1 Tax=Tropicimonas marinistellae TaxID=1739787 RepID=UPI00083698D6|nr:DUF1800 domain-containing protein [Tropicimonas marinistellae]